MGEVPTKPGHEAPYVPVRNAVDPTMGDSPAKPSGDTPAKQSGDTPAKPSGGHSPAIPHRVLDDTLRAEPSHERRSREDQDDLGGRAAPPDGIAPTRSLPTQDRYRLGAELGRGGMGRVVEAFDLQLGRTVALKEVLPRAGASIAKRFAREVQLTARLEHPSIVPLYDSGTTADGRPFYVMRRVSGRPLDQLMAQTTGLDDRLTLLPAMLAAIDAVAHAHRRGVIHRDLKPGNILVGELGETVVIDWGLAKVIGEDDDKPGTVLVASDSLRTQIGAVFGTPGFMAPEQARGEELDPRGDVYALGATLYQLLAGAPPHSGTSATEVIAKTGSREVVPVDVIAQGAPPELVAIVGKALAFDPAGRYADAGALGEDVRRFLAGQLVAAHRYTRRQRLWRFTRRHRAPLVVAALASVAVAVLAWVGVRQIMQERNLAIEAREEADHDKRLAEKARDDLQRSNDQLLVTQARALLDGNPTHAAAVLKEVPETSTRIGDARAVAQAAIVRGVAWSIAAPLDAGARDIVAYAELSPDARSLLQVSRNGVIRIWDLDRRRLVLTRSYAPHARALWVGGLILVTGPVTGSVTGPVSGVPSGGATAELVDPFAGAAAGASQQLSVGPISYAAATARGDRVVFLDDQRGAHLLDVAAKTARPLWAGHTVGEIAIAADGAWIALADPAGVVVLDEAGRELTRWKGEAVRLVGSLHGDIGVLAGERLALCRLRPAPVWSETDLKSLAPGRPIDLVFRGRNLDVYVSGGKIAAWDGATLWERARVGGLNFRMLVAADDLLIVPGVDGKLQVMNDVVRGELHLPLPLGHAKFFAQPGASRVVATGDGAIVGFDLESSFPAQARQPVGTNATFVDDETLLYWRTEGGTWQWYDLRSRRATPLVYEPHGLLRVIDVDPSDGRVLLQELANDTSLVMLRKNSGEQRTLVRGASVWGRLMPQGALIFGVGDGRVFGVVDGGAPREVVKLEGAALTAISLGAARFAAVSSTGELVRGSLAGGALVRARARASSGGGSGGGGSGGGGGGGSGGSNGMPGALAGDPGGRVVVAVDDRLLLWDRDVVEIARLDQRIERIEVFDQLALLELADHSIVRASLVVGAPTQPLVEPSSQSPLISRDGQLIVAESVNGQLKIVEVATMAAWLLPAYGPSASLLSIAPSSRRFAQRSFAQLSMWTLPLAPRDLGGWLDERTNATTDAEHALLWSWRRRP
jgi:Protein kinase domain